MPSLRHLSAGPGVLKDGRRARASADAEKREKLEMLKKMMVEILVTGRSCSSSRMHSGLASPLPRLMQAPGTFSPLGLIDKAHVNALG